MTDQATDAGAPGNTAATAEEWVTVGGYQVSSQRGALVIKPVSGNEVSAFFPGTFSREDVMLVADSRGLSLRLRSR